MSMYLNTYILHLANLYNKKYISIIMRLSGVLWYLNGRLVYPDFLDAEVLADLHVDLTTSIDRRALATICPRSIQELNSLVHNDGKANLKQVIA